jgi:hypothetical protein
MKPQLPDEIRLALPSEIVHHIYSYVPHMEKESPKTPSPSLQKELQRIQSVRLKGKSAMYMKEFEDFCLD